MRIKIWRFLPAESLIRPSKSASLAVTISVSSTITILLSLAPFPRSNRRASPFELLRSARQNKSIIAILKIYTHTVMILCEGGAC